MDRRKFLKFLGAGAAAVAAAAAIDPEELLWKPGAKTFFLPPNVPIIRRIGWGSTPTNLMVGDVFTIDGVFTVNPQTNRETAFPQQHVVTRVHESGVVDAWPSSRNTFLTVDMITREAITVLENQLKQVDLFHRQYSAFASGTVPIRTPQRFKTA